MPTEKQIQASRANGARSKGPVTPAGKQNSSRSSTRHGLLCRSVVLAEESPDRFAELLAALRGMRYRHIVMSRAHLTALVSLVKCW